MMIDRLQQISDAYDLTVKQYREKIEPLTNVSYEFRNSKEFKEFQQSTGSEITGSNAPENKQYLDPESGMKFLKPALLLMLLLASLVRQMSRLRIP